MGACPVHCGLFSSTPCWGHNAPFVLTPFSGLPAVLAPFTGLSWVPSYLWHICFCFSSPICRVLPLLPRGYALGHVPPPSNPCPQPIAPGLGIWLQHRLGESDRLPGRGEAAMECLGRCPPGTGELGIRAPKGDVGQGGGFRHIQRKLMVGTKSWSG